MSLVANTILQYTIFNIQYLKKNRLYTPFAKFKQSKIIVKGKISHKVGK